MKPKRYVSKKYLLMVKVELNAFDDADAKKKAIECMPACDTGGILRNVLPILDDARGDKVELYRIVGNGTYRKVGDI